MIERHTIMTDRTPVFAMERLASVVTLPPVTIRPQTLTKIDTNISALMKRVQNATSSLQGLKNDRMIATSANRP